MVKRIKPYMMPLAMSAGTIFYSVLHQFGNIIPLLIFAMLFITYLKMDFRKIKLHKYHLLLIGYQLFVSIGMFFIVARYNLSLAQGIMICVFAPTATSAPVIVGMLKGNVESLLSYSILSNLTVVFISPILFSFAGNMSDMSFIESIWESAKHIVPLLFGPFLLSALISPLIKPKIKASPQLNDFSFILWSVALTIVIAKIIQFITIQKNESIHTLILLAIASLFIAVFQFWFGRKFGSKYDDTIAFGQGLGQKNTVLAIWMAQTYLNPISSIGPGAYVIWQNIINSYQVWRKRKMLE